MESGGWKRIKSLSAPEAVEKIFAIAIPVLVFVASYFLAVILSKTYFPSSYLIVDDGREYLQYQSKGFGQFVFPNGRPITALFMAIGFAIHGISWAGLVYYIALFFGLLMVAFYFFVRSLGLGKIFSVILVGAFALSRLNWYYYASYFGVMESLALGFAFVGTIFLIRYIRGKNGIIPWLFALVFYVFAALSHERYLACILLPALIAIFIEKGWKRKIYIPVAGLAFFAFYLIYRLGISKTPLLHNGTYHFTDGSDFLGLLSSAWSIFTNSITLNDSLWYLSGVTNADLDPFMWVVFILQAVVLSLFLALSIVLIVHAFRKKNHRDGIIFLSLWAMALLMVAGAAVKRRVEPRWEYSVHAFLLGIVAFSCVYLKTEIFPTFTLKNKQKPLFEKPSAKHVTLAVPLALVLVLSAIGGAYALNNKHHYYINDASSQADSYYRSIYQPFVASGKSNLIICSDSTNKNAITYLAFQWGVDATITTKTDLAKQDISEDSYVTVIDGYEVKPIPWAKTIQAENIWTEKTYSFEVLADCDYYSVSFMPTSFPNKSYNGVVAKVNGKAVTAHYTLDKDVKLEIPLQRGRLNSVEIVADYIYNPSKEGTGEDIRDLGVFIYSLTPEDYQNASTIELKEFWTEKTYSFTVKGDIRAYEVTLFPVTFPGKDPNGVIAKVNGKAVTEHYVLTDIVIFEIPLVEGANNKVEIIADYTYNPSKEGTGDDIRDLGLYVISLIPLSDEKPPQENS